MSEFQLQNPAPGDKLVRLETTHGTVLLRLFPAEAPKAVENFLTLTERGYYDGIVFHRVIKNFMVQCGDPTGTGRGGESAFGHEFENEISPKLSHIVGALSMANAGPDTNGSQFFIVQGRPAKYLDGDYSVFGQVVSGQETVDAIAELPVDRNDRPKTEAKIVRATVETAS
jgi:cyclophilin family peptidyl-prolyl cis-trans isomerase